MNKCIYSEYCGGCDYQGIPYNGQLEIKNNTINSLLSSFVKPKKIIGMIDPLSYRNKVQVTFGKDDDNHVIYGNYIEKTHIIVPIKECSICDKEALEIIHTICILISKYKISVFDEHKFRGCIRHVLIRTNHYNEHMVVIVTGNSRIPKVNSFIKDLIKKHNNVVSIIQSINDLRTSLVLSDKSFVLYGSEYLTDTILNIIYRIGFNSFFQINKTQTEILYENAIKLANLSKECIVLDAYCGIGTITLNLSKLCKKVIGVEINKNAIVNAIENKKINNIKNAFFIASDATKFIMSESKKHSYYDVVFIDPPRIGCDLKFLTSLLRIKPKKIIYISCNPYTLKRDLSILTRKTYKVSTILPIDMFPFTEHIECIAKLEIH